MNNPTLSILSVTECLASDVTTEGPPGHSLQLNSIVLSPGICHYRTGKRTCSGDTSLALIAVESTQCLPILLLSGLRLPSGDVMALWGILLLGTCAYWAVVDLHLKQLRT